jgi:HAD superfamily hydrolase (TIGR01509 family)
VGESADRLTRLELPEGQYDAYLFDCDGTIVDSMPLHYRAWQHALQKWQCDFDECLFYSWGGKPVREIIAELNRMNHVSMPVEIVASRKEQHFRQLLPELTGIPAVIEQINHLYGKGRLAVVSGGKHDLVFASLKQLNLADMFELFVCAGDYARGKPAPDCFLMAAEKLRLPPSKCLVFEDTELGIAAATAAGMQFVHVKTARTVR